MNEKASAIVIVMLVCLWPVCAADAFASARIKNVGAEGSEGVSGYVFETDSATFSARLETDDTDVAERMQVILGASNIGAMTCESVSSGEYACGLTTEERQFSRENSYIIKYTEEDKSTAVTSEEGVFYADGSGPTIDKLIVTPRLSGDGEIKAEFIVKDHARGTAYDGKCSGFGKVELRAGSIDGTVIAEKEYDTSQCMVEDSVFGAYLGEPGEVDVCIVATDRFGFSSTVEKCAAFTYDTEGVSITDSNTRLLDSRGSVILHIRDASIAVVIETAFSSDDLDYASVLADVSGINGQGQRMPATRCLPLLDSGHRCEWELNMRLSSEERDALIETGSVEKSITFYASDMAGNEMGSGEGSSKAFSLSLDDTGPSVVSLKTGVFIDGKSYARPIGNKFIAEIAEEGSGLYASDVLLHIGSEKIPADSCVKAASWTCEWDDIQLSGTDGIFRVSIETDSKDRLGNAFSFADDNRFEAPVILDNTIADPDDVAITIVALGGVPGIVRYGDRLRITAKISDFNGISSAFADLSSIISSATALPATTIEGPDASGLVTAVWDTDAVNIASGGANRELSFSLADHAGNEIKVAYSLSIASVNPEEVADYYELNIQSNNILSIERETMKYLPLEHYTLDVPFRLNYKGGCEGDLALYSIRASGTDCNGARIYTSRLGEGNDYSGFIELQIPKEKHTLDSIDISACSVSFNPVCADTYFQAGEIEDVTLRIPITSDIKPSESLRSEIDSIKDDAESMEMLSTLKKILNLAQSICNIKRILANILHMLSMWGLFSAECSDSSWMTAFTLGAACDAAERAAIEPWKITAKIRENKIAYFLNMFCNMVSCTGSKARIPGKDEPIYTFMDGGGVCDYLRGYLLGLDDETGFTDFMMNAPASGDKTKWGLGTIYLGTMPSTLELAKKSWVFSVACFCIPGMIYNLEKNRQINCWKGVCLRDMTAVGVPVDECYRQDAYNKCVYQSGQMTVFLDILVSPIRALFDILSHPGASGWVVARKAMQSKCEMPSVPGQKSLKWTGGCIPYGVMTSLEYIADIISSTEAGLIKWEDDSEVDYCAILLEEKKEDGK